MRKIILFIHVSLDMFSATADRDISWVKVDPEMFDYVAKMTSRSDTALYGRKTYEIMQAYWPDAGKAPKASKHDRQHSAWYNSVEKVVISNTMKAGGDALTRFVGGDVAGQIRELKNKPGKDILMLASAESARTLTAAGLIDEYKLFVNPILLGSGLPVFGTQGKPVNLQLAGTKVFRSGFVGLFYCKI